MFYSRNNNQIEEYNYIINKKLQGANPNIRKFIDFLKKQDQMMRTSLIQDKQLSPYFIKQNKIKIQNAENELVLSQDFRDGKIDMLFYLETLANCSFLRTVENLNEFQPLLSVTTSSITHPPSSPIIVKKSKINFLSPVNEQSDNTNPTNPSSQPKTQPIDDTNPSDKPTTSQSTQPNEDTNQSSNKTIQPTEDTSSPRQQKSTAKIIQPLSKTPNTIPIIKPDYIILSSKTEWLTASIIDKFLIKFSCKLDLGLDATRATSLAFQGICHFHKRLLSKYRFVYGPVFRQKHWMAIFIDIEERQFVFVDPYGATNDDLDMTFANWIRFVEQSKDLSELHSKRKFTQRSIDHPRQPKVDTSNCGVFVCKILQMLLMETPLNINSFDPHTVSKFRADILLSIS